MRVCARARAYVCVYARRGEEQEGKRREEKGNKRERDEGGVTAPEVFQKRLSDEKRGEIAPREGENYRLPRSSLFERSRSARLSRAFVERRV